MNAAEDRENRMTKGTRRRMQPALAGLFLAVGILLSSCSANGGASDVDVDLTAMSSTMVYATVFEMMNTPEDYVGKTVRMRGWFTTYEAYKSPQEIGKSMGRYYSVLIDDATKCCQQGVEFVWKGEHVFPDEYPASGDDVTVAGLFETYEVDGLVYPHVMAETVEVNP